MSETRSPLVVVHPRTGDPSPLQANTARAGRARIPQAKRDASTGRPDRTRHVTCGNDGDGEPGPGRTQGRTAVAAARRFIIRDAQWQPPAAARKSPHRSRSPREPAQMTHAAELNPHKGVETTSRAGTNQTGLPSSARARPAWQLPGALTSPAVRCARDAPLPSRARGCARVAVMYCDSPSTGSIRGAQNGPSVAGYLLADARRSSGAGQVSPKGVMGLGRGPGRFCLGGEVLLEQVGADPEAGGTRNGAAGRGCCSR